jgi:hypothetical protein
VPTVVLLGPQRFSPTLGEAVARAGVHGRLASVTAGWQEREAEDLELQEHLGGRTLNLMLYARAEDAFERDPELRRGHQEKQELLRQLQSVYRIRLGHAQAALRELAVTPGPEAVLGPEKSAAMAAIRELDRAHGERLRAVEETFEARYGPLGRAAVARHVRAIEKALEPVEGVLIAGGHVAVLLNRLRLLGFGRWVGGRALFAWSAGAMVLSERVVVFHHSPPQGFGNTELVELGLARARDVVPFPHASRRLRLDDRRRMELLARRFAPAECLALADGAMVIDRDGERRYGAGVSRLGEDGTVTPVAAA